MKSCLELRKTENVVQMTADSVKVDRPAELTCVLFDVTQYPAAHAHILSKQCTVKVLLVTSDNRLQR